ncbi:MAG: VapC toxin family PIN domain ribonuclease [Nostocoides sp.]
MLTHPFVIGELAVGNITNRATVLALLDGLDTTDVPTDREVRVMVERLRLWGKGLSLVDAHLLAATRITRGATLWALDRRLVSVAHALGVAARVPGR